MKLLYCEKCGDVFNLDQGIKTCSCGRSGGVYAADGHHAFYSGECIPLGFSNSSLLVALSKWNFHSLTETFTAFIIEEDCPTFTRTMDMDDLFERKMKPNEQA